MSELRCIWITEDEILDADLAGELYSLVMARYEDGISPRTMIDDYRFGDCKSITIGVLATLGCPVNLLTRNAPRPTRGERRAARRDAEDALRREPPVGDDGELRR